MKPRTLKGDSLLAMGSVMEILPSGDYSEYLPRGTTSQRLSATWRAVGGRINKAIERNAENTVREFARRA